jgi:hypothetical protein
VAYHDNGWRRNNPILNRLQIYTYVYTTKTDRISLQDDTCSNFRYKDHNLNYSTIDSLSDDAIMDITLLLLKLIYQNWQLYTYLWLEGTWICGSGIQRSISWKFKIDYYAVTTPTDMARRHSFVFRLSNQLCPNLSVNMWASYIIFFCWRLSHWKYILISLT